MIERQRRFDAELVGRNYELALDLTPAVINSWDAGLWRGPRLLVPMRLEALVVTERNAQGPWVKVKLNPHAIPGYPEDASDAPEDDANAEQPAPFETYTGRPVGVHLHWALPDGLTRGTQDDLPEEVPAEEEEVDGPEQPEASPEQEVTFPVIPDRWLVVRTFPGAALNGKRRATAWVIESEEDDPAKRVTPLAAWRENRDEERDARWMTALGKGDPAFAAYYDNVKGILGFHDALEGVPHGPLSYLVVGWYSQPEDDPLYNPGTKQAWFDLLDEMGWTLDGAIEDQEKRVQQAADEAKERLGDVGLDVRYDRVDRTRFQVPGLGETLATGLAFETPAGGAAPQAAAGPTVSQTHKGIAIDAAMASIRADSLEAYVTDRNEFARYWPRQLLCHGLVMDVVWSGPAAQVGGHDARPANVGVAVGNTGVEALSALVAENGDQPNLEQVTEAFHYGVLSALSESDGLSALESLLHSEDFVSKPGGFVVDVIEEGDLFPQPAQRRVSSDLVAESVQRKVPPGLSVPGRGAKYLKSTAALYEKTSQQMAVDHQGVGISGVNLQYQKKKFEVAKKALPDLMAEQSVALAPVIAEVYGGRPRRKVPVRRGMPRYYEPKDPVVLLTGAGRSTKHGEDGYYTEDDKLVCRVTGETVEGIALMVGWMNADGTRVRASLTPADIGADRLGSGQIPPEADHLYGEALIIDYSNVGVAAASLAQKQDYLQSLTPAELVTRDDISEQSIARKIGVEQTLFWNNARDNLVDPQALAGFSGFIGTVPSPIALTIWRQPWMPLHLSWEVEWHPSPGAERDWLLEEHDFARRGDAAQEAEAADRAVLQGRTLLTPAVTTVMADRISKFLEDEASGEVDLASASEEKALGAVLAELKKLDVLATNLGGFHDALLGLEEAFHFTPADAESPAVPTIEETAQPRPDAPVFPLRAGHMRLKRLRVIDAFGRFLDLGDDVLSAPVRAQDVRAAQADLVQMPPRIVQPARLMFRLLQADDDALEATKDHPPICGWLLPDHLDEALEVYDGRGINQGQVQLAVDGSGVAWQGVPGRPGPLGGPPTLENRHLLSFAQGLLTWGLKDSAEDRSREPALPVLLRMIDATLWTVDPLGREGDEHLSVLLGRPLAVVRACLRLELEGEPASPELARTPLPVRLGALTSFHDGLIGYFVNDNYSQFYPVHEEIAGQTRPTRPRQGFLGAIQTVPDFYESFGSDDSVAPVDHPYINTAPTVKIRPNQTVMLTLLVDPRGAVHATTGFLPRKRIELMREHVAEALDNISVTFRIGPVLTDPESIRMPLPAEIKGSWSWVRLTGPTVWQEDPVVNATQDAQLSTTPAHITEGWLKVSGAFQEEEEEEG